MRLAETDASELTLSSELEYMLEAAEATVDPDSDRDDVRRELDRNDDIVCVWQSAVGDRTSHRALKTVTTPTHSETVTQTHTNAAETQCSDRAQRR